MAFFTDMEDAKIRVITSKDASIEGTEPDVYKEYLETLDESKLSFVEGGQPTRFVLRKIIPYKQSIRLKNSQVTMKDGELQPQIAFINEEVRLSLVDIENPNVEPQHKKHLMEFKRDGDGGATHAIMEKLEAFGVVTDLYTARNHHAPKSGISNVDKKKSLP